MENTYPIDTNVNSHNVSLLNINDIYFGPEMHQALIQKGKEMYGCDWEYSPDLVIDHNLFPLSRLEALSTLFDKKVPLPPIKVKNIYNKYDIIDGRHRVVLSVLYGYSHIYAEIV